MSGQRSFYATAILVLSIASISMSLPDKKQSRSKAAATIAAHYEQELLRFDAALQAYPSYFLDSTYEKRRAAYKHLAYQFKRVEGLFTYFHPKLSYESFLMTAQFQKRDFGPPFPDNWLWAGPFGIDPDSVLRKKTARDSSFEKQFIERSVRNFRKLLKECNYQQEVQSMNDAQIMDALRLELVRISTIGIANGDFVIEEAGMSSLEGAFHSWTEMVEVYAKQLTSRHAALRSRLRSTITLGNDQLRLCKGFQQFDRMSFLTTVLIPLSQQFTELYHALGIEKLNSFSALRADAAHVYATNAFNADYFAPGEEAYTNPEKVELGKLLFFDPILSDNNERACASCHKPELAFTDGNVKSMNFERGDLPRNAPTVINAAFQKQQFWDLRATSLEDQLDSVINSKDELHSSFENVIERINASPEYRNLFFAAFPQARQEGIQRKHVKIAIACYERELTGFNSRFDQYVRGDRKAMNAAEVNGFNIYMGKAKCGSCHYAPLFNGALPPYFDFTDHRSIGVPVKDTMQVYEVDPDMGAFKPTGNTFFNFSFKVPTVRNVEVTAPYMHNGVYKTLEQVINFYDHAGGDKFIKDMRPGLKGLPFFMILPEPLKLTDGEKKDLIAFLKALTDTSSSKLVPNRLPKLEGKFARLDQRKIGGVY